MDYSPKRLINLLKERGWELQRIKGSHHIYFNEELNRTIPVPIHGNRDMAKGTFYTILKQAGIDRNEV
ncbi:type II toxin-antitoxin system HicA family toxin [Spirosoma foliorum]|uniref:Type II toxin-antitoxin system HicA family toxin n=1 Tax=Spirosoma foliorum TaxID=2710596 RepID=A0A7G5GS01_9BACT|nr:type II toxin-antitoxin system HicA family toxin [Spirosoma foliorum]QMW01643.1 type II toxin-antitoxin system HicA family toxin [Spirosoma foliorum]